MFGKVIDTDLFAREYYMKKLILPIESKIEARDGTRFDADIGIDGCETKGFPNSHSCSTEGEELILHMSVQSLILFVIKEF